jgi:hypothetical protein
MNSQKVNFSVFHSFRRKPESSNINMFWMPVEDPVLFGDQVRHDGWRTFCETVKNCPVKEEFRGRVLISDYKRPN